VGPASGKERRRRSSQKGELGGGEGKRKKTDGHLRTLEKENRIVPSGPVARSEGSELEDNYQKAEDKNQE